MVSFAHKSVSSHRFPAYFYCVISSMRNRRGKKLENISSFVDV